MCNSLVTAAKGEVHVAETLKKGTRVTGTDRSKLATTLGRRYDSGESIRSLAASTGRSYGFVHRILTEIGVTLRGRGGATRSGNKTEVER
jgi:hypothetical protein